MPTFGPPLGGSGGGRWADDSTASSEIELCTRSIASRSTPLSLSMAATAVEHATNRDVYRFNSGTYARASNLGEQIDKPITCVALGIPTRRAAMPPARTASDMV